MCSNNKPIIVIGHKNPDTDSICSAICYADLKSKITNETYIAKRAGHLNEETQYVLKKYDINDIETIQSIISESNYQILKIIYNLLKNMKWHIFFYLFKYPFHNHIHLLFFDLLHFSL